MTAAESIREKGNSRYTNKTSVKHINTNNCAFSQYAAMKAHENEAEEKGKYTYQRKLL